MILTQRNTKATIAPPRHIEGGRENPFRQGFNKPQILIAVFLCLSVMDSPILDNLLNIMVGLFGQSLGLVAPLRGITTSFNTITNTVVSISGGYPTQRKGITA